MPRPLPAELLFHIVDLSLAPDETVSAYGERQTTLTSFCLVSHQFRDIAQLLLWRIFRPKSNNLALAASFPCLAKHIGVFEPREVKWSDQAIFKAVKHMPELVEVRLEECREISKAEVYAISHVEHLSLSSMVIASSSSVVFRNLVSLTVRNSTVSAAARLRCFRRPLFPSLKAFYSTCEYYDEATHQTSLVEPAGLGSQLDMIQVHL
ncbi:hypothetical protein JCM8547_007013 [Rhodosporidiobolus lusitaniae]